MRQSAVQVQSVWCLPCVDTQSEIDARTENNYLEGLSETDQPTRVAARVWGVAQYRAALAEGMG